MSVLACDRNGCTSVMCDRGNSKYYICWECFDELVASGPTTDIDEFMNSPKKPDTSDTSKEAYARYNVVFPKSDDY